MAIKPLKLTDTNLKKEPVPHDKPQWYRDTGEKGFRACIFKTGTIAFYAQHGDRTKKLGKNIKAADARSAFRKMVGRIEDGEFDDPQEEETSLVTVRNARDVKLRYDAPKSKAARAQYADLFDSDFEEWLDLPLVELKKSMVRELHKEMTDTRGPVAANHAIVALKAVINAAFKHYEDEEIGGHIRNPVSAVKLNAVKKRKPAWTAKTDFPRIWKALNGLANQEIADWIRFIALTGMRGGTDEKSESGALYLKWKYVEFKRGTLHVPGTFTKNGEPLWIPLAEEVEKILLRQRQRLEAKYRGAELTWVWPQRGRPHKAPINPWSAINVLRGALGFHFRPHDLRHHWNEIAKRTLNTETRKALGGWKMTNVDEDYGWDDPEELRDDCEKLTAKLLRRAEPKDDNVVQMRA